MITSKNNKLEADIKIIDGEIFYFVNKKDIAIINQSKLGIKIKGIDKIYWNLDAVNSYEHCSTWKKVWGSSSNEIVNEYNENEYCFTANNTNLKMNILLRAYDDCIAVRYVFPEQETDYINIESDLTEFNLTGNYKLWFSDNGSPDQKINQGNIYVNEVETTMSPVTIKQSDDCYVCIHEADLYRYEEGVIVKGNTENGLAVKTCSISALPHQSPWRLILVCDNLNELVTTNSIENLNPACKIADTSFIKPGKCMWDWRNHGAKYDDYTYDMSTESMKRYIDFAAENNVQYALIDGNWHIEPRNTRKVMPMTSSEGVDIEEICRYGVEKDVKVCLYINDEAFVYLDLDMILATYKNWGAAGIKHGFMETRGQRRSADTARIAAKCAEYGLLYIPHEPERPWGLYVTYPNMVATEFINAQYDGPTRPEASPTSLCTYTYTNCLTSPVDRSPVMFDMDTELERERVHRKSMSTTGSQIAQAITLFTGFLTLCDNPNAYNNKAEMFEFIREMPNMTWDETKLLCGEIGEYVCLARRSGDAWFVGVQNNEDAKEISFNADFLEDGEYKMTIYGDDETAHYINNREAHKVTKTVVKKDQTVTLPLVPGGGAGIWIRK